jgi:hypothetical protein
VPSAIYILSINSKFKETGRMHQVLLQNGQNCCRILQVVKLTFREETMSRTQTLDWFFQVNTGVTSIKGVENSRYSYMRKTDENVTQTEGTVHGSRNMTVF